MATDLIGRLAKVKSEADSEDQARENYAAYLSDRRDNGGWSEDDAAEYKAEAGRIMSAGTADEKAAAREFWAHKAGQFVPNHRINERIRESIAAAKERKAA